MSETRGRFWLCQKCARHVPARLAECRCGFSRAELGVAMEAVAVPVRDTGPSWFAVGPAKLVAMSVVTLGFYQVYWFYQQWRRVRDGGEDVRPLPRSLFGVIFGYSLFRRVIRSAEDVAVPAAGPGALTVAYILLCLCAQLPLPFALLTLLSVLPLAAVQRVASAAAERDFPGSDPNRRLTAANWVGVALGGALLSLIGYATFLREKPTSLAFLTKVAAEANRAPREPNNGIVLDRAVAHEGSMVYHFRVGVEARERLEERRPRLKELVLPSLCRDRLLKSGVSVRFVYSDPDGQEIAAVAVEPRDCRG